MIGYDVALFKLIDTTYLLKMTRYERSSGLHEVADRDVRPAKHMIQRPQFTAYARSEAILPGRSDRLSPVTSP